MLYMVISDNDSLFKVVITSTLDISINSSIVNTVNDRYFGYFSEKQYKIINCHN